MDNVCVDDEDGDGDDGVLANELNDKERLVELICFIDTFFYHYRYTVPV